uniref:Uncharacterized protein n=1 Tax=Triticum urartu TaxID=4572 RepID=A0A8R7K2Q8_TRIUA
MFKTAAFHCFQIHHAVSIINEVPYHPMDPREETASNGGRLQYA